MSIEENKQEMIVELSSITKKLDSKEKTIQFFQENGTDINNIK